MMRYSLALLLLGLPIASPAAVALFYGGHFDANADYDRATQVEPLHRIARNPKTIHWVETGHIFPREETRPLVAKWLDRVMP